MGLFKSETPRGKDGSQLGNNGCPLGCGEHPYRSFHALLAVFVTFRTLTSLPWKPAAGEKNGTSACRGLCSSLARFGVCLSAKWPWLALRNPRETFEKHLLAYAKDTLYILQELRKVTSGKPKRACTRNKT